MAATIHRFVVTNASVVTNPDVDRNKPLSRALTIRGTFVKDGASKPQAQPSVSLKVRDLAHVTFDMSDLDTKRILRFTRTSNQTGAKKKETATHASLSTFLSGLTGNQS